MNELWRDPTTNQCYLIPAGTELADGPLVLVSSTKERRSVLPTDVSAYACSSAEANQHIQERVTQMLELAGQEVGQFVQLFAQDLGSQLVSGLGALSGAINNQADDQAELSSEEPDSFDQQFDDIGAAPDSEFDDNVVELEFEESSEEEVSLTGIFEELRDELATPFKELQDVISSELVDLGRSLAQLGKEFLDELGSDESGDALENVRDWLNSMADGDSEEDSDDDDSTELTPEEEAMLQELVEGYDGNIDIVVIDEDAEGAFSEEDTIERTAEASADSAVSNDEVVQPAVEHSPEEPEALPPEPETTETETTETETTETETTETETSETSPATEESSATPWPSPAALKRRTKAQLLALAQQLGLDGASMNKTKAVILELLESHRP